MEEEFLLHFDSLSSHGHELSVPCDIRGHVNMDTLDDGTRQSYLYARALVGRVYQAPRVKACGDLIT
jgi:hypothetical protein